MAEQKKISTAYGVHTIDEMIALLMHIKKEWNVTGNTPIYLSDFEYNGRQTQFEISMVEERENELYLFYEMHEEMWDDLMMGG